MKASWIFNKKVGQLEGVNDRVELFRSNPIESLGKEICQNSLDGVDNADKPVTIEFETFDLPVNEYFRGIKDVFKSQFKYWNNRQKNNKKIPIFFENALNLLSKGTVKCLRISDFNTTGLLGSKELDTGNWNLLTRTAGVNDNPDTQTGSFGLGKFATFVNSDFMMVFYSTIDKNKEEAFTGVTRLSGFRDDKNEQYDGFSFYSMNREGKPIYKWISVDKNFKRQTVGTDIFIIAFNASKDWENILLGSLLDNYLCSFFWNKLRVKINGKIIDKSTIEDVSEQAIDKNLVMETTKDYYDVLKSIKKHEKSTSIIEDNDVNLLIKIGQNMNRKVAIVKKNGMKVFDKDRISTRASFAGILEFRGAKVDAFFTSLEDATHSKWDLIRAKDKIEAEDKMQKLFNFIKETFTSLFEETMPKNMDAIGAGEFFPDFKSLKSEEKKDESITDNIVKKLLISKKRPSDHKVSYTNYGDDKLDKNEITNDSGTPDENGDVLVDKPGQKGGEKSKHTIGSETEPGKADEDGDRKIIKRIKISQTDVKIHTIKINGDVIILINPKKNIESSQMEVFISGEKIREKVEILKASKNENPLSINKNVIKIMELNSGENNKISITPKKLSGKSLEVDLYEIKKK